MQMSLALPDIDLQFALSVLEADSMLCCSDLYSVLDMFAAQTPPLSAKPTAIVIALMDSLFIFGSFKSCNKPNQAFAFGSPVLTGHSGFLPLMTRSSTTTMAITSKI
jgi:hypothetical protein